MSNIKKKDFYNAITGNNESIDNYGINASTFKKVDNVDMVFDSRGQYLGIRTCRGKIIDGIYKCKVGICDFKSFTDLRIWDSIHCPRVDLIETKEGNFVQISK